jgi:hypothetical protein
MLSTLLGLIALPLKRRPDPNGKSISMAVMRSVVSGTPRELAAKAMNATGSTPMMSIYQ